MISILHFTTRLASHGLALSLISAMITMMLTNTVASTISSPPLVQSAFAYHGQEIVLTSKDVSFAPVSSDEGHQLKAVVNYAVHDPMVVNDLVKGVMKVYSPDGKLLKTSSSPTPFPITDSQGTVTLATTLIDPNIQDVIAKIVFTNPIKTETISNELPVSIDLIRGAVLSKESQEQDQDQDQDQDQEQDQEQDQDQDQEQDRTIPQEEPQSESESEEEASTRPLSEEKLMSTESAVLSSTTAEEEQPPAELEETPIVPGEQQITSTESLPLTNTDNPLIAPTTITPPESSTPTNALTSNLAEVCDDGIDNDNDALIDFIDEQCNLESQPEQQHQQQSPRQEQAIVSTPEICDDDLDNDFDGKVDSRDEECSYITSSSISSIPPPEQGQPVTDENTRRENVDTKQQSNEDLSEESGENANENSDGEENKDDDNSGEDEEDRDDEDTEQQSNDDEDDDDGEDE
jgi:hypothetical protein